MNPGDDSRPLRGSGSPLRHFLPKLHTIIANEAGSFTDPWGHPMPPCIVMERGEPLDVWSHRSSPYKTMAYVVRTRTVSCNGSWPTIAGWKSKASMKPLKVHSSCTQGKYGAAEAGHCRMLS